MACPRGCCSSYREHISSLGFRPTIPAPKKTVDHTDSTINTVTEHWHDRQDVNIRVVRPPTITVPKKEEAHG